MSLYRCLACLELVQAYGPMGVEHVLLLSIRPSYETPIDPCLYAAASPDRNTLWSTSWTYHPHHAHYEQCYDPSLGIYWVSDAEICP